MINKKALLFDLDGTVVDSCSAIVDFLPGQFQEKFGIKVEENTVRKYFPNGWKDAVKKMARDSGRELSVEEIDEFVINGRKIKNKYKFDIFPGVREIMTEAKENNIPMALCSNNFIADLEDIISENGLKQFFDLIVGDDMVEKSKPEPDMFLYAAEKFQIEPKDCVVFEDSSTGIKAAKAAGMPVIAVSTGAMKREDLLRFEPTVCVDSLEEINLDKALNL